MTCLGRPYLIRQALQKDGALSVTGSRDAGDHVARKSGGPHVPKESAPADRERKGDLGPSAIGTANHLKGPEADPSPELPWRNADQPHREPERRAQLSLPRLLTCRPGAVCGFRLMRPWHRDRWQQDVSRYTRFRSSNTGARREGPGCTTGLEATEEEGCCGEELQGRCLQDSGDWQMASYRGPCFQRDLSIPAKNFKKLARSL